TGAICAFGRHAVERSAHDRSGLPAVVPSRAVGLRSDGKRCPVGRAGRALRPRRLGRRRHGKDLGGAGKFRRRRSVRRRERIPAHPPTRGGMVARCLDRLLALAQRVGHARGSRAARIFARTLSLADFPGSAGQLMADRKPPGKELAAGVRDRVDARMDRTTTKKLNRRQSGQPTISDVARLANCSPMTVSRVINNETSVREQTRAAVLDAIEQLNYKPNRAARSLAGAAQMRIALLYSNPSASYLSELLMGSLEQASRSDVHLVVERCEFEKDEERVVSRLVESGIDGFLLPSPLCDETALTDRLAEEGSRAVLIGTGQAHPKHSSVMIDEYQAAYDMTQHIIGLGHDRIGFIIGNPHQTASGQRLQGYLDAMTASDLEVEDGMVMQGQFTWRSGYDAAVRLLDQPDPPT